MTASTHQPTVPGAARHRVFFALWPDPPLAEDLQRIALPLGTTAGGRAMVTDTLHLTLAFLGSVSAAQVQLAKEIAAQVHQRAFTLNVDRLDYWPHNHILWAGSSEPNIALTELAVDLHARLNAAGFALEQREFAAHITLRRNCPARRADTLMQPRPMIWQAREFVLVESKPRAGSAHYEQIGRWPLYP